MRTTPVTVNRRPTLTVNRRDRDEWSLAGWLLCQIAGLDVAEKTIDRPGPSAGVDPRPAPISMTPVLDHHGVQIWDPMAIGEYLNELPGRTAVLPNERKARARCRSMCAEVHRNFIHLRAALPMSLKSRHHRFKVWDSAQLDLDRIVTLWQECLSTYGGPYLFGSAPTMADAMYAPMCTRVVTYNLDLPAQSSHYVDTVMGRPDMIQWLQAAHAEPEDPAEQLECEF